MEKQHFVKTIVLSDIHLGSSGSKAKEATAFLKQHRCEKLILNGDIIDGWQLKKYGSWHKKHTAFFRTILKMMDKHDTKVIYIRGNHDDLLMSWLEHKKDNPQWFNHGGKITMEKYSLLSDEDKQPHIDFLKLLENYYLDSQNRLFIHAGFTNLNGVEYEYFPKMFYWERTLWENALSLDPNIEKDSPYYPKRFTLYKEIFIGHTPVTRVGKTKPMNKANIWNVDTGAAFKGPLTILDVDTKEFWQSDSLPELYPNEKGRN